VDDPIISGLIDRGVTTVYYMAHLKTMAIIAQDGIRSLNSLAGSGRKPKSIAHPDVQALRTKRLVFGTIPLHEYVPFYFTWFTSMQRVVERRSTADADTLVFADVLLTRLKSSARCCVFTDGNAAKEGTTFSNDPKDLDRIDWGLVKQPRRPRSASAELLVLTHVPVHCITQFVCRSLQAALTLKKLLAAASRSVPAILIDRERYITSKFDARA
jgi:hypothetical protein